MKTTKYNLAAVALTLAVFVISTASSAQAQAVMGSDQILILNPDGSTNPLSQTISETGGEPLAFIAGTATVPVLGVPVLLFNLTAGVTVWLEPGSNGGILPTNTTIGLDGLFTDLNAALTGLLGPSAKLSDVFGITADFVNNPSVIGFGLLSDNEITLSVGSFGVPTQTQVVNFQFETNDLQPVGNFFLSSAANAGGYGLFIGSDVPASEVPEPSTWVMVAGGLGMLTLLRRRSRA